jgi:predicted TIM-barrel fold metal-dependent hydrolase
LAGGVLAEAEIMIIDCHCHAGEGDGLTGPWNTDAPLGAYLRRARAAGIARTNLLPAFHSDYAVANRALGRIVRRGRGRFFGFAFVHAASDAGRVDAMVREAVVGFGFRGIKVHRHDARISREICEVARRYRLPVLYDVVGEIAPLELIAQAYRDVAFIIPHLGSFADDWRAQQALIDPLARHPNLFADTSGVRRFDLLVEAVRRAGPHKLLFGTDGPWLHPGVELAKIQALGLAPDDFARVTGGNFLRLIRRASIASASADGAAAKAPNLPNRRPAPPPGRPTAAGADPWLTLSSEAIGPAAAETELSC